METKGPDNHNGKDEADAEATILRFPRDWFGPTEELVPFGPRADGVAVAEDDQQPVALDEALPPSSASAFWSEDSARIHDAVEGPSAESAVLAQARVADEPHGRRFSAGRVLLVACCGVIGLGLVGRFMFQSGPQRALPPTAPRAAVHARLWTAVSHPSPLAEAVDGTVVRRAKPARKTSHVREPKPAVSQSAQTDSSGSTGSSGSVQAQAASAPSSSGSATQSDSGGSSSGGGAGGGDSGASAASAGGSSQQAFGANGALGPGSSPNS